MSGWLLQYVTFALMRFHLVEKCIKHVFKMKMRFITYFGAYFVSIPQLWESLTVKMRHKKPKLRGQALTRVPERGPSVPGNHVELQ